MSSAAEAPGRAPGIRHAAPHAPAHACGRHAQRSSRRRRDPGSSHPHTSARSSQPRVTPEGQHLPLEVRGPGLGRARRLARARVGRALRAEREAHRAERMRARGLHALRRGAMPAGAVDVAVRPRRAEPPVARAEAVVREECIETVGDVRAGAAGSSAGSRRRPRRRTSAAGSGRACGTPSDRRERATGRRTRAGARAPAGTR